MAFSRVLDAVAANAPTIVITFSFLFFSYIFRRRRNSSSRLPPGPFSWPIIGNLHQLGKLAHSSIQVLASKYGPIMSLRLGHIPVVVVSSTEMAKEFLTTHDLIFANRPPSAVGKHLVYDHKSMGFSPYGDYWRFIRKIWMTELTSAKRLKSFSSIREEEVLSAMRSIWEKSEHGRVAVNISKAVTSISSAIIWRILAGIRYSEDDVVGEGKEVRDMAKEVMVSLLQVNIGEFIACIDWLDLQGVKRRMKKTHKLFDRVVQKIIDQHVQGKASNVQQDIIDVLLDMADRDVHNIQPDTIKAIIFDMLTAGIETTAASLEWTMSEMVRNPHSAKILQDELESVVGDHRTVTESDLVSMEYLQSVVKESLRLHPPAPLIFPHESTEDRTVGASGFLIPTKTRLMINVWAIGRDPSLWDDPLAFKPERFMGKDIDIKGRDFQMIPFGAGRRGCPGAVIAMGVMELTIAQLMHCFDWTFEGDPSKLDMSESFQSSLRRKEGLFAIPALKLNNCI